MYCGQTGPLAGVIKASQLVIPQCKVPVTPFHIGDRAFEYLGESACQEVLTGYKGLVRAARGFRFLKDPQFLASSFYLKKAERIMALLMVMAVCLLVYAAMEYRIRTALSDQRATFPDQKAKPTQAPTARWVFHYFVGIHVLRIPGQWDSLVVNLTETHQALLRLLGEPYKRYIAEYSQKRKGQCGMYVEGLYT